MSVGTSDEPRFNPFPGLRAFRSDEHHLFFGREDQTAAVLRLLRTNRFLAVVGTSGSGKSSLVRAGLIPELHGGTMVRAGSTWEVVLLRPGGRPLENLARALIDADLYDADDPGTLPRLRTTLGRSRFGIVEAVKQSDAAGPDMNLLVVVDQFEELFRFRQQGTDSEEVATAFVNLLLTASAQEECQIYVTLTMRSDYLGDCSEIPGLAEAVNRGEFLIPRLLRDQKRDAIEKPVGVGGARISPLLVQRLLNDIGDDADQLPVLQHALMRMWDVWSAASDRDRPIDFCDFEATGGLANALSRHADEIYESLPDDRHRYVCERIFKTLTEKGPDNRGIRRPTRLERLEAIAASDRATVTRVLDAFRTPGVTFIMPDIENELGDRTVVDLSHESLMRGWQRLRVWVEEEAQSARIFHRLSDTASLWRDGKAGLFRDPDLQVGLSWREDERPNEVWAEQYGGQLDTAIAFLERSRQEARSEEEAREAARQRELEQARRIAGAEREHAAAERRAARRLKWLACGIGAIAVVALAAFLFALEARKEAQRNEKLAEERRAETEKARVEIREQLYVADMNRVGRAYADGSHRKVVQLLNAHRPEPGEQDLRGFEWYYWWRASHLDVRRYRSSGAPNHHIEVSTDGNWVAVLGWPRTVRVLDRARMRPLLSVETTAEPFFADLSRDGAILATSGSDDRIRLIRTSDWTRIRDLQVPRPWNLLAFSPTADTMASSATGEGQVTLWDTNTWESETVSLDGVVLGSNLAFSADGSTLALGSKESDFPVVLWNVAAREIRKRLIGHRDEVTDVAWSPDGRLLASGSADETVRLWSADLDEAGVLRALGPVRFLSFSPDSKYLGASLGKGNAVLVWNTESKVLLCTIRGHRQPVGGFAFMDDGSSLWTVSQDGYVKSWDIRRADRTETVTPGPDEEGHGPVGVTSLAAGQALLLYRRGHGIRRRDLGVPRNDGQASAAPRGADGRYEMVALSPGGRFLATCSLDGLLRVRDLERQSLAGEQRVEPTWEEGPTEMRVSRDGRVVALARRSWSSGWLAVCDLESREQRQKDTGELRGADLSADGDTLATWGVFNLELWDWRRDERLARISEVGPVRSVAFSPDSSTLAVGFWDNNIYTYSVQTHERAHVLEGHSREVTSLAFSPDGRTLASGSMDSTLKIWRLGSGKLLSTLTAHRGTVDWLRFAPDGYSILSTSTGDDGIKVWRRATEAEVARDVRDAVEILESDGRSHRSHREWRQALAMLNDAIGFRPNEPQLLARRGDALIRLGHPLEALADYRKAVEFGLEEARAIRRAGALIGLGPWVAASDRQNLSWRHATEEPGGEDWNETGFDDTDWMRAVGPFGNVGEPTRWNGRDIWLRHEFELEDLEHGPLVVLASVDDAAEIYLNGVLATRVTSPTGGGYRRLNCAESACKALRRGTNVIAAHCRNTGGEGRIDVGLYTLETDARDNLASFLTRALDARRNNGALRELWALELARRGDWKGAAVEYLSLVELDPDDFQTWMRAATLLARAGETTRYREALQKRILQLGDGGLVTNAGDAEKVAKIGLMVATVDSSLERVTELAIRARSIAAAEPGQAWVLPWAQLVLGCAEFRNGNYREAIRWCEKSLAHDRVPYRDAQAKFILAMAHFHANDLQRARQARDEGERIFQDKRDPTAWFEAEDWHDWIICQLLREEARDLFGSER